MTLNLTISQALLVARAHLYWQRKAVKNEQRPALTWDEYLQDHATIEYLAKRIDARKLAPTGRSAEVYFNLQVIVQESVKLHRQLKPRIDTAIQKSLGGFEHQRKKKPCPEPYNELDDTDDLDARYRRELAKYGVPR